jgi:hypothetical protein
MDDEMKDIFKTIGFVFGELHGQIIPRDQLL